MLEVLVMPAKAVIRTQLFSFASSTRRRRIAFRAQSLAVSFHDRGPAQKA